MDRRETKLYGFLKKCEQPPTESAFWLTMNFLFNALLTFLGRVLIALPPMRQKDGQHFVLMTSMNMGDFLFLYRSLENLKRVNHFPDVTVLADPIFRRPLEALGVERYQILPFWKIMALDKIAQLRPDRCPHIVMSVAWYFFGMKDINAGAALRSLPCRVSAETLRQWFPAEEMKGRTVILSPYEQTATHYGLSLLPRSFWTTLARLLLDRGFFVLTNCNGKTELPIDGTGRFFPQFGELAGAVEYAGYCVSMRSGFTDWISSAKLKKEAVLYPTRRFYELYNMELLWGKKPLEYIYGDSDQKPEEMAAMIAEYITREETK